MTSLTMEKVEECLVSVKEIINYVREEKGIGPTDTLTVVQ